MALNVTLRSNTYINAKVSSNNGLLSPTSPLTIKNIVQEQILNSIEDLPDVSEVSVTDGATLVYNSNNDLYEVKQINLDGGEY